MSFFGQCEDDKAHEALRVAILKRDLETVKRLLLKEDMCFDLHCQQYIQTKDGPVGFGTLLNIANVVSETDKQREPNTKVAKASLDIRSELVRYEFTVKRQQLSYTKGAD